MQSEWAKLLDEALKDGADKIPEGWLPRNSIAAEWGKTERQTDRLILSFLKTGKLERRAFRVLRDGNLRLQPYYRVAGKSALPKAARA